MERAELLPVTTLAYLGDAVYEVYVRERLVKSGPHRARELHREATRYVCARSQAQALVELLPSLSPVEEDVVRRARNSHPARVPKGSDQAEYRLSTAFEALVGFLHLSGERARLDRVVFLAMGQLDNSLVREDADLASSPTREDEGN